MNCEYVAQYYGVPACIGRRVVAYGKPGIIAEDRGNYIGILLDSDKPGNVNNYHPCDGIEYLGMGKVRQMTASQRRYAEYIRLDDCFETFHDFLQYDAGRRKRLWA